LVWIDDVDGGRSVFDYLVVISPTITGALKREKIKAQKKSAERLPKGLKRLD